jgi:hypothetical protein
MQHMARMEIANQMVDDKVTVITAVRPHILTDHGYSAAAEASSSEGQAMAAAMDSLF